MAETAIETMNYSTNTVEHRGSPISMNNETMHAVHDANNIEIVSGMQHQNEAYQSHITGITSSPLINRKEIFRRTSSSDCIDQLANQTILPNLNQYPINQDPNPEYIRRPNNEHVIYRKDIAIRYLQPPTPPPPGPIVVREIRAPLPPEAPPLVIHQRANAPMTPPPMIIRERPPMPPRIEPPCTVNKVLPPPPPLPRKVIIERQAPLPPKPQPVIIEKWLPYKPSPERRVIVERAPPVLQRPIQKNTIITHDAPHVDLIKNVRHLGVVRADPLIYTAQYGQYLSSNEYVYSTMAKFGLGDYYTQMTHIPITPHSPILNNNHLQANYAHINSQQSMTIAGQNTSNIHQLQNENQRNYIENHAGMILPDQCHSTIDGFNQTEIFQ
ncbi:unnamed protein product [Rotaria sp. Silwood2]|nr:unnamed protein product [Rotaria sp. Silwood2]CAF2845991.1 unnamed protein product [Rotaria sp. Silwood2]CAF3237447.1 unnamed protein product [Rotaria sp. Silwood2]CAF4039320.1 unnamed protein product [Rotaria sp. Silwood2]CAF4321947.1 unnamed protein product [Rotaria sp. Silwood2]